MMPSFVDLLVSFLCPHLSDFHAVAKSCTNSLTLWKFSLLFMQNGVLAFIPTDQANDGRGGGGGGTSTPAAHSITISPSLDATAVAIVFFKPWHQWGKSGVE